MALGTGRAHVLLTSALLKWDGYSKVVWPNHTTVLGGGCEGNLTCDKKIFGDTDEIPPGVAVKAAEAAKVVVKSRADTILSIPLWQHSLKCVAFVGLSYAASSVLSRLLHNEADKVEAGEESSLFPATPEACSSTPEAQLPFLVLAAQAAFLAVHRPAALFLPILSTMLSVRAIATWLEVAALHGARQGLPKFCGAGFARVSLALRTAEHLAFGVSEVAGISFVIWTMLRLKERLVQILMKKETSRGQSTTRAGEERTLERIVLPLSGLASWLVVCIGCLMALHVLGINIQPLLTVGGVSGVVVGLSAQSVVSNMVSGVNLFLSRPFIVGERIDVAHSSGAKFVTGYVERVDPMRTILRTDTHLPIMIPNKVLADMIITNESRIHKSVVVSNFNKPRQLFAVLSIRYKDRPAVEAIAADMRDWLARSPLVDKRLPCGAALSSLDNHACNISVLLHTTVPASRDFGVFKQNLLLSFADIIDQHGAHLAMPTQITQVTRSDLAEASSLPKASSSNGADSGVATANLQQPLGSLG